MKSPDFNVASLRNMEGIDPNRIFVVGRLASTSTDATSRGGPDVAVKTYDATSLPEKP